MLVVDAMNVLGARPDGWWRDRDAALRRLLGELSVWAERTGTDDVLAVADGWPVAGAPPGAYGAVRVLYGGDRSADDRIVAEVGRRAEPVGPKAYRPGAIRVVTADRELRRRVEALGARTVGPRWLLDRMGGSEPGA